MRVHRAFAEYQLRALGRHAAVAGERLRCATVEDARALVREIERDGPVSFWPLLLEFEAVFGDGITAPDAGERVARLIVRGLVEVIRRPLTPLSEELPELFEFTPHQPEPFQNEISDGVSVIAEAAVEPILQIEVAVEVEPAPVLETGVDVTPAAAEAG